jgi:hypothetical protein
MWYTPQRQRRRSSIDVTWKVGVGGPLGTGPRPRGRASDRHKQDARGIAGGAGWRLLLQNPWHGDAERCLSRRGGAACCTDLLAQSVADLVVVVVVVIQGARQGRRRTVLAGWCT